MKYQKQFQSSSYDVIVIGSGISGLVCGANLIYEGLSVLVLEQHYQPGGMTSFFKRNGFEFEAGGHRVTAIKKENGALYKIFKKMNKSLITHSINPSYAIKTPDLTLEASLDLNVYRQNIVALFPDQKNAVDQFLEDMLAVVKAHEYLESTGGNPDLDFLAKNHPLFIAHAMRPTAEFLEGRFSNPDIIPLISMVGNYSTLPLEEQSFLAFSNMWKSHHTGEGMSLIQGGTRTLIESLVDYIDNSGGQVVVKKKVEKVLVKDGKAEGVATTDGDDLKARAVVSAASDDQTYMKMLDNGLLDSEFLKSIESKQACGSCFQVYLGLEERESQGLDYVTTFASTVQPSVKGLFKEIAKWDLEAMTSSAVISVQGKEMSPEGYRCVNISCPCPYEHPDNWFIKGDDKSEYNKFKKHLAQKLIEKMTPFIPDLKNRIRVMETATPLTMERYTLVKGGGIHGLAYNVAQTGPGRGTMQTPIPGYIHVGQYVFPGGGGIFPCAISGEAGAEMVLEKHFRQ